MVDLTTEMAGLWAALGPSSPQRGRVIQIVAANSGEGVSTVAREYARLAAVRARRPVWLVDGDLAQQGQTEAAAAEPDRFGMIGRPAQASPDGSCFFAVTPRLTGRDGKPLPPSRLLTARPCLGGRLWITRFAGERLRSGQRARPTAEIRYWDALRAHAEAIVIDCPAAERNDMAVVLAPVVDATILVVAADQTSASESLALRDEIEAAGGEIAGVVVNRSTYSPPGFFKRFVG